MSQHLLEYEPVAPYSAWHHLVKLSPPFLTVSAILTAWATAIFGMFLVPIPIIVFALLVPQRRWRLIALCLALSPMSVGFLFGSIGYFTGTATLQGMGLPGPGYFNIDPELRCERSTGGCITNGGEALTQTPNNWAVVALTCLFGPQRGAYTGPYPNETQAKAALTSATPVSIELLAQDQVDVTQPPVKLDVGIGKELLRPTIFTFSGGKLDEFSKTWLNEIGPPSATVHQGQCIILRIPVGEAAAMIVLLDAKTGRPFAYYAEGGFFQRVPPVRWRK
jgi:hypothetical protein